MQGYNADYSGLLRAGAGQANALANLGGTIGQTIGQNRQQEQMQSQQNAAQQEVIAAMKSGDPDVIAETSIKYPQFSQQILGAMKFKDEATKANFADTNFKIISDPENAETYLVERANFLKNSGADPSETIGRIEMLKKDPQAFLKITDGLTAAAFPDAYKSFKTTRPESMTEFQSADLDIKRENTKLRALEAQASRMDQSLKGETNELKRQELQAKVEQANLKVETQKQKLAQTSTDINSAKSSIINEGEQVLSLLSEIENSPGFSNAVGAKGLSSGFGAFSTPVAGTAAADVAAKLETLGAKNFLASIKSFKDAGGAGALSDSEGKKLTAAMTNLSRDQTEASLRKNLVTVREIINKQIKQAQGGKASNPEGGNAPDSAVQHLMQNPNLKAAFKAKYGYLPEGV